VNCQPDGAATYGGAAGQNVASIPSSYIDWITTQTLWQSTLHSASLACPTAPLLHSRPPTFAMHEPRSGAVSASPRRSLALRAYCSVTRDLTSVSPKIGGLAR
jgi:hypothetical protein